MNWQTPFEVRLLKRHEDLRGFLFEIIRFADDGIPGQGQIYTFSIEPGKRRGDHYHLKKQEWFTCVYGTAIVLLSSSDGQVRACKLSSEIPKIVYAAPLTAHALVNESDRVAVIVSYSSTQHNPEDEDTYPQVAYQDYEI